MAFQTSSSNQQSNENWKADGFLNMYLPSKDGVKRKLGAIPLRNTKVSEKDLLTWLNADPSRVSVILSKLIIEYQSAAGAGHTFDLG